MRTSLHSILTTAGVALLLGSLAAPVRADILYVSSYSLNAIERFTSDGGLGVLATGLDRPEGLAFDSTGILYVAVAGRNTIEKFSLTGAYLGVFANTGLSGAGGLAFDRAGNLYAATGSTIQKFTPDGVGSVFADVSDGLSGAFALAFDSAENLYVSNASGRTIEKFTPDGVGSVFASTGASTPYGLTFDSAGNLYVATLHDNAILKFTLGGVGSLFASTGSHPDVGLAFDSAGDLYTSVSPSGTTIFKISPDGVGSPFASGPLSLSQFLAFTDDFGVPVPLANQRTVPEPTTWALLGLGLPALLGLSRPRWPLQRGSSE